VSNSPLLEGAEERDKEAQRKKVKDRRGKAQKGMTGNSRGRGEIGKS